MAKYKRKPKPQSFIWALFDANGDMFSNHYDSAEEAHTDAVGPRFWFGHTVRTYRLLTRKEEKALGMDAYVKP